MLTPFQSPNKQPPLQFNYPLVFDFTSLIEREPGVCEATVGETCNKKKRASTGSVGDGDINMLGKHSTEYLQPQSQI